MFSTRFLMKTSGQSSRNRPYGGLAEPGGSGASEPPKHVPKLNRRIFSGLQHFEGAPQQRCRLSPGVEWHVDRPIGQAGHWIDSVLSRGRRKTRSACTMESHLSSWACLSYPQVTESLRARRRTPSCCALCGDAAWAVNSHRPAWHHEPGKTSRLTRRSVSLSLLGRSLG